jgi:hypothetical protein
MSHMSNKWILFLVAAVIFNQSSAHESLTEKTAKSLLTGIIGSTLGFVASSFFDTGEAHVSEKVHFLRELRNFVESAEYLEQGDDTPFFAYFYQGLNELAQNHEGAGLVADFAKKHTEQSVKDFLQRIVQLEERIIEAHQSRILNNKVLGAIGGALVGGAIPFMLAQECSGNCGHHK